MRNLKKVLSLVLCVAMMLSVMVVGAGAAFADQNKITHTKAVDQCVALKIIDGKENNKFDPTGNVTRAEMAKMICVALNGGKAPVLGSADKTSFTDTKGHWGAAYIEACFAQGIVSGVGNNKFEPDASVTPTQAAKMLLVALGFKSENEGFTGPSWAVKVNIVAASKHLYDELVNVATDKAMTRDDAAQMIYNTLNANLVEYKTDLVNVGGQWSTQITVKDKVDAFNNKITFLKDKYNVVDDYSSIMTDVSYDKTKKEYTYTFVDDLNSVATTKTVKATEDFSDLFGMKTKVLYTVKSNKVDSVLGMVADGSKIIASGLVGDLKTVSGDTNKVKLSGVEYKLDSGKAITAIDIQNAFAYGTTTKLNTLISTDDATQAYEIDLMDTNDDGKIDTGVVYPFTVHKVTYAGAKSITAGTSYTFEDNNIADGIKKDDYVVVVADANTVTDGAVIVKADVVSGKVTGKTSTTVKVDDTWHDATTAAVISAVSNGNSYDFTVVNGYIFAHEVTAETSKDVLFVSATDKPDMMVGETSGTQKVAAYFSNGDAKSTITVTKIDGAKIKDVDNDGTYDSSDGDIFVTANVMYTYKVVDGKYELKVLNNASNKAGYDTYSTDSTATAFVPSSGNLNNGKIANYTIADDAVIFVKDNSGVKVMTGKQVASWTSDFTNATAQVLSNKTNGIEYVKVATLVDTAAPRPTGTGDVYYGFMTADSYTTTYGKDETDVTAYQIWNGKEEITVYDEIGGDGNATAAKGTAISYTLDGSYVVATAVATSTKSAITGFDYKSEGTLAYDDTVATGSKTATLAKDCVFIAVDSDNKAKFEGGMAEVALAKSEKANFHTANAYVVLNTDGKVAAVIYDIPNNQMGDKLELAD